MYHNVQILIASFKHKSQPCTLSDHMVWCCHQANGHKVCTCPTNYMMLPPPDIFSNGSILIYSVICGCKVKSTDYNILVHEHLGIVLQTVPLPKENLANLKTQTINLLCTSLFTFLFRTKCIKTTYMTNILCGRGRGRHLILFFKHSANYE